jgi:hypothetical protein
MSLSEISNILWRERRLLDLLVFKLEVEQLVLASGRTRWLSHATREVEKILEEAKCVELERAMAVEGSAGELGISDTPTLRELAAVAPTPGVGIFAEHRRSLLLLTREIDALTKANRDLLRRGRQSAREELASLGETCGTMPDRLPALRLVGRAI